MTSDRLRQLLGDVRGGHKTVEAALEELRSLPFAELGFATVDHHRAIRRGFPEVIYGAGKTAEQILAILGELRNGGHTVLVTRICEEKAARVCAALPSVRHEKGAQALVLEQQPWIDRGRGTIAVLSAGTSDLAVAEEAALTAHLMGHRIERIHDVGIAGLHRLLAKREVIDRASVLVVVAGMEGALPSVVGGLVRRPVVAVPTSVGYGASFQGLAALLAMLNSCAAGVTVVNIDNGFGAGYAAALINQVDA